MTDTEPAESDGFNVSNYLFESDGSPAKLLGSLPDIANSKPATIFKCGEFILLVLKEPATMAQTRTGKPGIVSYPFSLAVLDAEKKRIAWFLGIEETQYGTRVLGLYDYAKSFHENLGEVGPATQEEFVEMALKTFRERTGCFSPLKEIG